MKEEEEEAATAVKTIAGDGRLGTNFHEDFVGLYLSPKLSSYVRWDSFL